ncbi:putative dihydroflavonol-4-reductase [Phtheirospermum japonicum]|uniref:Putative dihydroflavonol-4-reductase n=1 Tax=Phtheirospermum japonicum TaxID=374723 RepID=A0A830D2Y9_9LAMI|nr:putative dihydroflavonol-4-reductase [Phtheirospermum japonicum]
MVSIVRVPKASPEDKKHYFMLFLESLIQDVDWTVISTDQSSRGIYGPGLVTNGISQESKTQPLDLIGEKAFNMKKVVLVTGASGFLGGRLCHALLNQGYSVKAFVRRTSDISALPLPTSTGDLQLAYGDVTDYPSLLEAFSRCHVIFHAAALVEPWIPDPSRFFSVNVGGLKNVLKAYKETRTVEKIIYTSSFFALGSTDGHIGDETQVHSGKYFCTEYEKSKAIADKLALDAAAEGVPIVPVYPGVIYGPGKVASANLVALLLVERFNGRLPGYMGQENGFSFCHVDDVVQGHIAAMNNGRPGERYLLTGENASFKDVFDEAAMITRTAKPRFRIPFFLIEAYGWLCVLVSRITGKLPLISPPTVDVLRHQWAYTCEKAKTELDYDPRSLKQGLTEMLPWLKSLGLIEY